MVAKINKREMVYRGRVIDLVKENITLPNSVTIDMDLICHPGAAAIVALSEEDDIILIRQYRHAVGGYIWEIPAGTFSPGEPAIECAKRELIEETGFSADKWELLGEITPVPGYSNERIHIFLATGLKPAKQQLDKDEVLDVHKIGFDTAKKMIYQGEIQDGKTICGIFMALK